ncbi:MAG: hypothetical protein WCE79_10290 [Xanthobacteraceae bacterium]
MALLEHWRSVILGRATDWRSPIFFFPKDGVLGNTDALALLGIPYTVARLRYDEFLSYDLSYAALYVVGFISMALLLRDGLRLSHPLAILGSILFIVSGNIYQWSIHAQLLAVMTVPLMLWLAIAFVRHVSHGQRFMIIAAGAAVFSTTCLTGFYVAWFFVLLVAWAAIVAACMLGFSSAFRRAFGYIKENAADFAIFALVLVVALYPFIALYLPRVMESGPQPLSEAFIDGRSQRVWDLVAVGGNNYFWGDLLGPGHLGGRLLWHPSITPIFGVVMLCTLGCAFAIFRLDDLTHDERTRVIFVRVFGLGSILLWLSFLDWGSLKPYTLYYRFVPGGSVVRVPARLLVLFPAVWVPIVMIGASWIIQRTNRIRFMVYVALAIMILEQHPARPQPYTDVVLEQKRLGPYRAPPKSCASFYVVGRIPRPEESEIHEFYYGPHVDAMILAYRFRVPTLNGNSTLLPPGWRFTPTFDSKYLDSVHAWISQNKLTNVCSLDLSTGKWTAG